MSATPFPIDWTEWRAEWSAWREAHASDLRPSSYRFGPKNILADEVLGVWSIGERAVELSEVVFNIQGNTRYVGITFGEWGRTDTYTALAASFADLERELGLGVDA